MGFWRRPLPAGRRCTIFFSMYSSVYPVRRWSRKSGTVGSMHLFRPAVNWAEKDFVTAPVSSPPTGHVCRSKAPKEPCTNCPSTGRASLGATWDRGLRPPYERLYTTGPDQGGTILSAVQSFYRKGGLSLEDDAGEPSDFLFVELDFIKRLCLREIEAWSSGRDGTHNPGTRAAILERASGALGRIILRRCREIRPDRLLSRLSGSARRVHRSGNGVSRR